MQMQWNMKNSLTSRLNPSMALAILVTALLMSSCASAPKRHIKHDDNSCNGLLEHIHTKDLYKTGEDSIQFAWPVEGIFFSKFGARRGRHHDGIDISAPAGTPIVAAADGEVVFSGRGKGYGNIIFLSHSDEYITVYAHNRANLVESGDQVKQGEVIAKLGRTGRATGNHLHFEVRHNKVIKDPLSFLPVPAGVHVKRGMSVGGERYVMIASLSGKKYSGKDSLSIRKNSKLTKKKTARVTPKISGSKVAIKSKTANEMNTSKMPAKKTAAPVKKPTVVEKAQTTRNASEM